MTPKEFAKKIIASINPGTADISGIGDGTIKGAISEQNKNLQSNTTNITNVTNKVNNLSIPFINTSNALYTQSQANFSYTATEDCVIAGSIEAGGSSSVVAYVNNVRVGAGYNGAGKDITVSLFIPLKKGQTFKLESNKFNSSYPLKAFALL